MNYTLSQIADELKLTKGRISQLVGDGTLQGCYEGDGRQRRFDLVKVADALGRKLDPGQRLGNGARSEAARKALLREAVTEGPAKQASDTKLDADDPDRYQMARTLEAEARASRLRRQNALEEGTVVLRSAVETEITRALDKEIAGLENAIRDSARALADQLNVDYNSARAILRDTLRAYRTQRSGELTKAAEQAGAKGLTAAEHAVEL